MANKITANLFTNAAFTKAFRTSLNNSSQRVVYNGNSWKVGDEEFSITNGKVHAIRACLLKFIHKIQMLCSYQYCNNYKKCVKKFEKAHFEDWPKKVAQKAKKANQAMMEHEYLLRHLPQNILNKTKEITELNNLIAQSAKQQQQCLLHSPQMNQLDNKKALLDELKSSLDIYISLRIKKEEKGVIDQVINILKGEDKKLSPQLERLALEILAPVKLNPLNNKDRIPFLNKIDETIKNINLVSTQIMNLADVRELQKKLTCLDDEMQQFQNEQAQAPARIMKIAQNYDDTKLLTSPPKSPTKAFHQKNFRENN